MNRYDEGSDLVDLEPLERTLMSLLYSPSSPLTPGVPISGKTRLMKLMFLLSREGEGEPDLVAPDIFRADKFGPYSDEVEQAVNELRYRGWVSVGESNPKIIALTPKGLGAAARLWRTLTERERQKLFNLKFTYNHMPISKVLYYVYSRYPDSARDSDIRQEVLE